MHPETEMDKTEHELRKLLRRRVHAKFLARASLVTALLICFARSRD